MKIKAILVVAIALVSSVAFADEPGNAKLVVLSQKEAGVFKVIYENAKSSRVKMTIFNSKGQEVYTETIKTTDGFIVPVNFQGMGYGEYSIEVQDETGKQSQRVVYNGGRAQRIHVAKLSDSSKYLLSVSNTGNVNVRIIDGSNNIVHEQTLNVNGNYGLVYNLKTIEGTPTFEITDASGVVKTIRY